MIFDNALVTALVLEWQKSRKPEMMCQIIEQSRSLVESIVSIYNPLDRDDLIQESYIKVQHAAQFFNPDVSNLHNYFTTVIRNCCCTYSTKQNREHVYNDFVDMTEQCDDDGDLNMSYTDNLQPGTGLEDIIERNRKRFPSLTLSKISRITKHIYNAMLYDGDNGREIIAQMTDKFKLGKTEATIIYNSSVIYLRNKNVTCSNFKEPVLVEYSLLPDFKEVLDDATYQTLIKVFSGMTLHITK